MIKVLELFGGIGACSKALSKLNIDYKIIDYVEIDKFAVASFNAINNTDFKPQDICKWNKNIEVDLIMHGSPCQDFSIAGKQAGGDKGSGTRSSLMYETIRIVKHLKPKYIIWENVKNILSKKHIHNFYAYLESMNELGYNNYYKVLNSKDYGIPQNRERVFTVSVYKDIDKDSFLFPEKETLKIRLKDMLETNVDKKYYLDDERIDKIKNSNFMQEKKLIQEKEYCDTILARDWKEPKCVRIGGIFDTEESKHLAGSVYDKEQLAPTLDTMAGGWRQPCIAIKNATKKGYTEGIEGDSVNLAYPKSNTRRGRVGKQVSQTLTINDSIGVIEEQLKIRKLTPKECWRLMGFTDQDFEKAKNVPTSNTQLYKQAGNSIVVNVLQKILKNLLEEAKS